MSKVKKLKDITGADLLKNVCEIVNDISGSKSIEQGSNAIAKIKLSDGRKAEVHVLVTTNENDFLL